MRASWLALCLCAALGCTGCTEASRNLVSDPAPETGTTAPDAGGRVDAAVDAGTSLLDAANPLDAQSPLDAGAHVMSALCGKRACACDDGLDNDHDGLIDGLDPECTGPFDDDETSFGIGKPNKQGACRDCFWDDNAGSGDDDCHYPAECLTGGMPASACGTCSVSDTCVERCVTRAPNGCDCFGCCEIKRSGGSSVFVELTERCSLDQLDDQTMCPRCVQNTQCLNPCGRCELCLGRTESDLPADCAQGQQGHACDEGGTVCSVSADCPGTQYCHQGCCVVELL